MTMEHKNFPSITLKVDTDQGIIEHVVAVMGILDKGNDIIHPGAFTKTLSERGTKVRVLDAHNYDTIKSVLGKPLFLREVDRAGLPQQVKEKYPEATGALIATTQFLMETPEGKGAFVRMREGAVDESSIGYDAIKGGTDYSKVKAVDGSEVTARNLREIKLWEYSPVIWGMNPATTVLSAKETTPAEAKPAPDVTENIIRMRQRDPGDFAENAFGQDKFRTIAIGDEADGIQAVIGKLKGETTTTIQSYLFDKDKWTVDKATQWIKDHPKADIPDLETKAITDEDRSVISRELRDLNMTGLVATHRRLHQMAARGNLLTGFSRSDMNWYHAQAERELRRRAEEAGGESAAESPLEWSKETTPDLVEQETPDDDEEKHHPGRITVIRQRVEREEEERKPKMASLTMEEKIGRMISKATEERLVRAFTGLLEVFEAAGIDIPGYSRKPQVEPPAETSPEKDTGKAQAGPLASRATPTIDRDKALKSIEIELLELSMEV